VLDGEFEGTVFPLVPGHEATGTVVALGPGADQGRAQRTLFGM
jgi:D-arabinose 1-dehydrogenase-like Zn-dependent alcohol dehydrogenase